jgi:hypothetical protein
VATQPRRNEMTSTRTNTTAAAAANKVATAPKKEAAPASKEETAKVATEAAAEAVTTVANAPTYKPESDSTPALKDRAAREGRLILDWNDDKCLCGCKGDCLGRFQPGHDAKLRGKLNRAAYAGVEATVLIEGKEHRTTPKGIAKVLTTEKHDWVKAMDAAVELAKANAAAVQERRAEAAKKAEERKAAGTGKSKKVTLADFA